MKLQTTAKKLRQEYGRYALAIGYCDAWHLLKGAGLEPFAYTAGVYGWNCDAYDYKGILITTGYRGTVGLRVPYSVVHKYEEKARAAYEKYSFEQGARRVRACTKLLEKLIKECFYKEGG